MINNVDQLFQKFFDKNLKTKEELEKFYALLEDDQSHAEILGILAKLWDYMEINEVHHTSCEFERKLLQLKIREEFLKQLEEENRQLNRKIAHILKKVEKKNTNLGLQLVAKVKGVFRRIKNFFEWAASNFTEFQA